MFLCRLFAALIFIITISGGWGRLRAQAQVETPEGYDLELDGTISAMAVQPDGRIIIGGSFFEVDGVVKNRLARLNPDGGLDTTFNASSASLVTTAVAVQNDGKILVGGTGDLYRFNADGTVDTTFAPVTKPSGVSVLAIQPDGKIMIGGGAIGGVNRTGIARLHANGTLDTAFVSPYASGSSNVVRSIVLQADGRYLVGGSLANSCLQRLSATGTWDVQFGLAFTGSSVANLWLLPDQRLLGSHASRVIFRTQADGTVDSSFNVTATAAGTLLPRGVVPQADGQALVYGDFNTAGGLARAGLARVQPEGLLSEFDGGLAAGTQVHGVLMLRSGRLLIARQVTDSEGSERRSLTWRQNDPGSDTLVVEDGSKLRWLRSGAVPDIIQAYFELSTDGGLSWTLLGQGVRVSDGWELAGAMLPEAGEVRARGRTVSGVNGGSTGLIETVTAFGGVAAGIAVEQPAGTPFSNGDSVITFPNTVHGEVTPPVTVVVRNTGTASLVLNDITWADSALARHYKVDFSGTRMNLPPGWDTSFKVSFTPKTIGDHSTELRLHHNAVASPFVIRLGAVGLPSSNANLASLTINYGVLPVSSASTSATISTHNLPFIRNSAQVTATAAHAGATITFNGVPLPAGGTGPVVPLAAGTTVATLVVTAEDGVTQKTRVMNFVRTMPVPGDVEPTFDAGLTDVLQVNAMSVQADGGLMIGGSFTSAGGTQRLYLARFLPDGSLDPNYAPSGGYRVDSLSMDANDRVVAGGPFVSFTGSSSHRRLVRLNQNGTKDTSLSAVDLRTGSVKGISHLSDGRLGIQGDFRIGSPPVRSGIAVVNADGSLHPDFNLPAPAAPWTLAPVFVSDTEVLVGEAGLIDLKRADGTTVPGFESEVSGVVYCVLPDRDGSGFLLGGDDLRRRSNNQALPDLVRITREGKLDAAFVADLTGPVHALARQADGKILVGGYLYVPSLGSRGVARIHANGSVDAGFNSGYLGSPVDGLAILPNGEIMVKGEFYQIGGLSRIGLVRMKNGAATQQLGFDDANTAHWILGGTAPEAASVRFEYSTDLGATWAMAGMGVIHPGGWKGENLDLPVSGLLRARGTVLTTGGSTGVVQSSSIPFTFSPPQIEVAAPVGTPLAAGAGLSFAETGLGGMSELNFQLGNTGGINLNNITLTVDGADAGSFTVVAAPPPRLAPGAVASFSVRFSPAKLGPKTAVLHIASTDLETPDFIVHLSGKALAAVKPVVTTLEAVNVHVSSADITGTVNERGYEREVFFEYGLTAALGSMIDAVADGVDSRGVAKFEATLPNLLPHTKYHYRLSATGAMGSAQGTVRTFITANRAPNLMDDTARMLPGATVALDVIANDAGGDPDGDTLSLLSFRGLQPASAGKLSKSGNKLIFTASATFAGATCLYTAADGFGGTDEARATFQLGDCTPGTVAMMPPGGGTAPLAVNASGLWTAVENAPWLSVTPAGMIEGNGSLQIVVQPNAAKTPRSTVLTVGGKPVEVRQAGVAKPQLRPSDSYEAPVSSEFGMMLEAVFDPPEYATPVTFRARNLPPGLTLSRDGTIYGTFTKAGTYHISATASTVAGVSDEIEFDLYVLPLDPGMVGTFHGYVGPGALNRQLGSRIELTTTATGAVTGKIITGTTTRGFAGSHQMGVLNIAVAKMATGIQYLSGELKPEEFLYNAWLGDELESLPVQAWRNPWTSTNKASDFKGRYTFALEQPQVDVAALPQGYGFGAFTVAEDTGKLTVAGRLADGSPLTTSTFVGKDGQVLLYQPLANGKGGLVGQVTIERGLTPENNLVFGSPEWTRGLASARLYPDGFTPFQLNAFGSTYPALAKGAVLMGLPAVAGNAELFFAKGGLDKEGGEFLQFLTLSNPSATGLTNKAKIDPAFNSTTLPVIDAATGAFNGTFTLPGSTAALNRKSTFQGQLVRYNGVLRGYGHFILAEPKATAKEQATAPQWSGSVLLRPRS